MHNHPYDELAYVVEGEGVLHWEDGTSMPVAAGSCIYFPRLVFHSLENVGDPPIRIMGVFHPAGSPADRVAELDY
jgi:mannose-6-phosphate isomerase-like protein (cupin superfamily)